MATEPAEEQRDNNVGGVTGRGFLPGQSGNPGGRPAGRSITARLRVLIEQEHPRAKGKTLGDLVAEALIRKARRGDVRAIRELLDRTEGKAPVVVTIAPETPLSSPEQEAIRIAYGRGRLPGDGDGGP